jgi:hypothetical protein
VQTNKGDALVILSGLVGVFVAFWMLATMLPPAGMALVLVLILIFGLMMAIPGWVLVSRLTSPRRDAAADARLYEPPATFARPRAPEVIDVMRFDDNGQTRPLLPAPKPAAVTLRTRTQAGDTVQASAEHLERFARLDGPSRSQWTGDRGAYSACVAWFVAHGMLEGGGPGRGYRWGDEYADDERRISFVRQFTDNGQRMNASARARAR